MRLRLRWPGLLARRGQLVAHHVAARLLERTIERRLEQVRVAQVVDVLAPHDPQPDALLPTPEQLARVVDGQLGVGRHDRPAVLHRVAFLLLAEDFPGLEHWVGHQAAAAGDPSTVSRTHAVASQFSRRNASRASDIGPWFVTTVRSSCQSGSP